jgi:7,8-dihydropterin-6-yl-methyl-4-(beta-D-ribofuranosyl)aminobenzene 5'-phosphate synthase
VLQVRGQVEVHSHPDIFMERIWSCEGTTRYIGIPHSRKYLESLGAQFHFDRNFREIGHGVYLTGEIPRTHPFEKGDANMTAILPSGENINPDPIHDDLSLVVDSDQGLIVVLGCAHAGMINILEYVCTRLQRDRIFAVIGGTHLGFADQQQFAQTLQMIDQFRIERIGVSHCTGLPNAARLYAKLKERFFFGTVGAVLEA